MTAAIRTTPTPENYGASVGEKTVARNIAIEIEALWRYGIVPLTSVSGTNTITASVDTTVVAALTAYQKGQHYSLIPAVTSTNATVTLNINSVGAVTIKDVDGAALAIGALVASRMYVIEHDGTNFRIIGPGRDFIAATQAEQETGTSIVVGVVPGRQQYHNSALKAWLRFNGTGTPAINASYNCSSITDRGTGKWTVNFTTAFSSVNYGGSSVGQKGDANDDGNCIVSAGTTSVIPTSSSFPITSSTGAVGVTDTSAIYAMFAGDQA